MTNRHALNKILCALLGQNNKANQIFLSIRYISETHLKASLTEHKVVHGFSFNALLILIVANIYK